MSTLYLEKKNRLKFYLSYQCRQHFFDSTLIYYPRKTYVQDNLIEHVSYKNKQNSNNELKNGVRGIMNNYMINVLYATIFLPNNEKILEILSFRNFIESKCSQNTFFEYII